MAEKSDTLLMDFIGGEVSQYMAARTDLNSYLKSLSWCQNFIILPQGGLKYRAGTALAGLSTDASQAAGFISFQFSASDSLMIFATDKKFRFFRDDGVVLNSNSPGGVAITGITQANPCVVTAPAHGLSSGQEVILLDFLGMQQLQSRFFIIANVTTDTFSLVDPVTGVGIDSTNYDAYVANGTMFYVFELVTPYLAADLFYLRYDQIGDLMYICCKNPLTGAAYPPYKLTRKAFTNWTIATFSRTNDPFAPVYAVVPTGITQASPAVVHVASTTAMATGDVVIVAGIVGMTELNGNFYQVNVINGTQFSLADLQGNDVDSTGFSAWSSAGTFTDTSKFPSTCAFTGDGRQSYANTGQNPSGFWASELASGTSSNFDNFTAGSADNNAIIFALTPVNGTIDNIQDLIQFSGNIAFLNSSTIELMFGATPGTPPTPSKVGTQPTYQGAYYARGLVVNWDLIFIDINQTKMRGMQFNLAFNDYQASDYNLASQHLGEEAPFIKCIFVRSNPEIIWILRADGVLLAFTFNNIEKVQAFSRVYIGGNGKVIDIATIRNSNGTNELWLCVQRTINGHDVVTVEFLSQWPVFPALRDFYSGDDNQEADEIAWANASWEVAKDGGLAGLTISDPTFLDASLSYDGHDRTLGPPGSTKYTFFGQIIPNTGIGITLSGTTGNITITADDDVFQPSDVNCQIWKDYDATGRNGGGRAQITQVVSSTVVNATVVEPFDNTDPIAAGYPGWGFAIKQMFSLDLYEGMKMSVTADGGKHVPAIITNGSISLSQYAEVIQVGFSYIGFAATQNIAPASKTGPTAYKPRTIKQVHAHLCETTNIQIGPSEYMLQQVILQNTDNISNRTPPPFSGVVKLGMFDSTTEDAKQIVIVQTDPTPCTLLALDVEMMLSDRP